MEANADTAATRARDLRKDLDISVGDMRGDFKDRIDRLKIGMNSKFAALHDDMHDMHDSFDQLQSKIEANDAKLRAHIQGNDAKLRADVQGVKDIIVSNHRQVVELLRRMVVVVVRRRRRRRIVVVEVGVKKRRRETERPPHQHPRLPLQ